MRLQLKPFQEKAVAEILSEIAAARIDFDSRGRNQAIVLSSPTGSGKTITLTAVIEATIAAAEDESRADSGPVFLWVSDSPELNAQSRDKLLGASDSLAERQLILIDHDFDHEVLSPGCVYFLNTQKLARTSLLVRHGDERSHTIWETIASTIQRSRSNLIVIIDEAHRGMTRPADIETARTLAQRFIVGSDEIPPVPIVVGMSATPQRFADLLGGTPRVARPVVIDIAAVRESGLLKDRIIIYHPIESQPSDLTLLSEAVRSWATYTARWAAYCSAQAVPDTVRPMLVIQVEDGSEGRLTRTDLGRVVAGIREEYPSIESGMIAHAFEEDDSVIIEGLEISKVQPSRLQQHPTCGIVLFKRALTTGWDCPRAEVMMSFRRAVDHTLIAQLVGRMVRAPLARRIVADDHLNAVELYLPYYDREALNGVIDRLTSPDPSEQTGIETELGELLGTYSRAVELENAAALVETLPSYLITHLPPMTHAKRLLRLAYQLTSRDAIDGSAIDEATATMLDAIVAERDRLSRSDDFARRAIETGEVELRAVTIDMNAQRASREARAAVSAASKNIDDLFDEVGRRLAPSEGLHTQYWKQHYTDQDPARAKIEFIVTVQDPTAMAQLERIASMTFDMMFERNKQAIRALPEQAREFYRELWASRVDAKPFPITLPLVIEARRGTHRLPSHLYQDANGNFDADLNDWEALVVKEQLQRSDVVAWLRNQPRKRWSLCISYEDNGTKGFYPDFIFVRRGGDALIADVIEPHDIGRDDSWKKAKGMARYAELYSDHFGRLLFGMVENGTWLAVDVNTSMIRDRMLNVRSNDELRNMLLNADRSGA